MKHRLAIGLVVLGLLAYAAVPASGQAVVAAQIETFWRQIATATSNRFFTTLGLVAGGHINFGTTLGDSGYGIRDSGGIIQIKNSGGAWAQPAASAPTTSTYLIKTADGSLPNAQVMGSLATGIVINTTATGVQSVYAGTTCANQFPRSLSASGVATCASVSATADMTGTLQAAQFPALTGDITTSAGSIATTLANTGVGAGSVGSATAIPTLTIDAKGRITVKGTATPQLTLTSTYFSSLSGANLTGLPTTAFTGVLQAAQFPALTGDVTSAGASLATVVGKVGGVNIVLGGAFTTTGASALTLNTTAPTNLTLPTAGTLVSTAVTTLASLGSIGTVTVGVWNGTVVGATYGGTGVNNGASTVTLGGSLTFAGAFATTFTVTAPTALTLPTAGTLVSTTVTTLASLTSVGTLTGLTTGTTLAGTPGTSTLGTVAAPFASLIIGTAATNNLTITPAAFAAGSVATVDDPGIATAKLTLVKRGTIAYVAGALLTGTCSAPVTAAVAGLATTTALAVNHNAAPGAVWQQGIYFLAYPTVNTVNVIVCNPTAGTLTPNNATFNYAAVIP